MKKHVLLIDDDEVFHYLNSKIIALSGLDCTIDKALNGSQALDLIYQSIGDDQPLPDYIFVDLDMPVMGGFEFIKVFKGLNHRIKHKTKIIILTSSESAIDKQEALTLGVDHFLSKPLSAEMAKLIFSQTSGN